MEHGKDGNDHGHPFQNDGRRLFQSGIGPQGMAEREDEEKAPQEESLIEAVGAAIGESVEDMVDTVKAVASVVSDKIEQKIKDIKTDVEEE